MATLQKTRQTYIDAIANKRDFKSSTGNLRGQWEGNGKWYRVYSYQTVIAEYGFGAWSINTDKYSVTTTHHQSIVHTAMRQSGD